MSSVADAPLADLCRGAGHETLADFAAALHEARGWSVERRGEARFVASTDDGERSVGVVHPADGPPDPDVLAWADAVVAPDTSAVPGGVDVEVIDVAALGQQLSYAVDRSTARGLLRSHFGWTPPPEPDGDADGSTTDDGTASATGVSGLVRQGVGRSQILLAAVLLLAVAGGVAVVVAEEFGTDAVVGTSPGAVAETPTPSPDTATPIVGQDTATPTPDEIASEVPTPGDGRNEDAYSNLPPGLDPSGEIDRAALLDAHGSVLGNSSYRLTLTYQELENGRPTGVHTETIRVENETRYSVSVRRRGMLRAPVPAIARTDVYANGSVRFERTDNGVERGVVISYDRYLAGHTRFLSVFLDVRSASIADYRTRNGTARTYVVTEGNGASLVRDTAGSFDVREDGLVTRAGWSYGFSPQLTGYGNRSARYQLRVTDVGETVIDRPAWVDLESVEATNATATPAPDDGTETATG